MISLNIHNVNKLYKSVLVMCYLNNPTITQEKCFITHGYTLWDIPDVIGELMSGLKSDEGKNTICMSRLWEH